MKCRTRFTIAGLMAVVLVASFALAALRSASATWAGGLYLLTHGVLVLAVVGAVCRGISERAFWLGFALFGLVHLRGISWYGLAGARLPTMVLLEIIRPKPVLPQGVFADPAGGFSGIDYFWVVGHCLWSLLVAAIGGMLAHFLFATPAAPIARRARPARPPCAVRRRFAAVGLTGLVACTALIVAGVRSDPAFWAGAVYMLTWVVLGIAALGFACGRGRRRMICLGAALFGLGYMVLNRSRDGFEEVSYVHQVADSFLDSLRPWLPPVVSGYPAATADEAIENVRIKNALDRPIPMKFAAGASLEDVLSYIRETTQTPDGRQISIYVDPIGLQEAEKTMLSPIQIDIEGRPLSTTLRLALQQLAMLYFVGDGQLYITAEGNARIPVTVDYYLLLGHCVLALLAAGLGALLVPLVSARADESGPTIPPGQVS